MHVFGLFLLAVLGHWVASFGGIALLIFALYEKYWKKVTPNTWFWGLAAVLLFYATFQAWRDEYGKTQPGLQLSIDEDSFNDYTGVTRGGVPITNQSGTFLYVIASVRNLNAPSIAEEWEVLVQMPGQTEIIKPRMVDLFNFPGQTPIIINGDTIPLSKLLYKQTLTPIAQGDKKQGLLLFFIDGISMRLLAVKGTKITLTCRDVANNLISTPTYEFTGINEGHRHYPGLE